jgi:hypothetical protein
VQNHQAIALVLLGLLSTTAFRPDAIIAQGTVCRGASRHRFPLRLFRRYGVQRTLTRTSDGADCDLAALRRAVEEGYGKVDHFYTACFGYAATVWDGKPKGSIYFGEMAYGFDRKSKQLAIFKEGRPKVLVHDRHLFLYLWEDAGTGTATYLEVVKPQSITWNDVDEAERIVTDQCPLAGYARIDRCMVLPLLEGGTDRLFAGACRVLMRTDTKDQADIFELGHPQSKITIGLPQPVKTLDPGQYPRCFRVNNVETDLAYAVDRLGIITAVVGIVAHEAAFSVPGGRVFVLKKSCGGVGSDQRLGSETELPLELPLGSNRIGIADLKKRYRRAMFADADIFQARLDQLEKELKEHEQSKKVLLAQIAECRLRGQKSEEYVELRAELQEIQDANETYRFVVPRLRDLITDLRKQGPDPSK